MNKSNLRRTPKVFGTSYQPKRATSPGVSYTFSPKAWRPIFIILVVVLAGWLIARLPIFQIKSVAVEGVTNSELTDELQSLVGRSIFTSQLGRTTNRWLSHDQSLATLSCRRGIPNTVRCSATTRQGVIVWRQGGAEYWVDERGRAFAIHQPNDSSPLVVEDRLANVQVGTDVASAEIIDAIRLLHQKLTERSIVVKHYFISDVLYQPGALLTSFPIANQSVVQKELSVYFAITEAVEAQARTLASLLAERGDRITDHIDLRVPGYVYYR